MMVAQLTYVAVSVLKLNLIVVKESISISLSFYRSKKPYIFTFKIHCFKKEGSNANCSSGGDDFLILSVYIGQGFI